MKEIISQTESKLETYFKRKLKSEKRKWAEDESVKMFGKNLKSLLLTKPIRIKEKSRLVLKIFCTAIISGHQVDTACYDSSTNGHVCLIYVHVMKNVRTNMVLCPVSLRRHSHRNNVVFFDPPKHSHNEFRISCVPYCMVHTVL